ncbi:MAG TPA: hypothetical protein VGO55_08535 [Allosphingosinicella sp.]|jgi:hypothetical protein|nr:hypothetical protein [Allosphingosinicella sp.]
MRKDIGDEGSSRTGASDQLRSHQLSYLQDKEHIWMIVRWVAGASIAATALPYVLPSQWGRDPPIIGGFVMMIGGLIGIFIEGSESSKKWK